MAELEKGGNPFLIPKTLKLDRYKDLSFYEEWFPLKVQAVIYQITQGPNNWRLKRTQCDCSCPDPATTTSSETWKSSVKSPYALSDTETPRKRRYSIGRISLG